MSKYPTGDRTRNLPSCGAGSQPTAPLLDPLTGDITRIRKYLQFENFANAKLKRRKGAKYKGLEEAMEIWLGKRTAYDIIMDRNYFKVMYEASP